MTAKQGEDWWNEERVAELKARWESGQTGKEICLTMGATSRSAVLGKAWRLGLRPRVKFTQLARNPHAKRIRKRTRPKKEQKGDVVMTEEPKPPTKLAKPPKRFIALRMNECRFPISDDKPGPDMLCCGAPVLYGHPYCSHHFRIAYGRPGAPRHVAAVD
jgi:GcrA cell cycle regulator